MNRPPIDALDRYQVDAYSFATYPHELLKAERPSTVDKLSYAVLGLAGEAGELSNKMKKVFRDDGSTLTQERREQLAAELGDVLWYVAAVANEMGYSLSVIAEANLMKLGGRKVAGTLGGQGDYR